MKNYLNPSMYVFADIREYDISKANINVLLYKGIINSTQYEYIKSLPRMDRQYLIGNMCKNSDIQKALSDGIIEFKKRFFESNSIDPNRVLSIKNDAVFLMDIVPRFTKFDNVEFLCKNHYTMYMKIFDLELYYYLNRVNQEEKLDIKGISDEKITKYHSNYMVDFLLYLFEVLSTQGVQDAILVLKGFYDNYINYNLDIGYYRELNSMSIFRMNIGISNVLANMTSSSIGLEYVDDKYKRNLNISYNLNILRVIWSYLGTMHYDKRV